MRAFLDRLPSVVKAKAHPARKRDERRQREIIARLLEATLHRRQASMSYHSFSRGRTKTYRIHPYRLVYADGGLYLFAFVPEYAEMRTFAVERIRTLATLPEMFAPVATLGDDPFPHSLGVNQGTPQPVEVEFDPRAAPYVGEREWHSTQEVRALPDGSVRITMTVCHDRALKAWILGFGQLARVVSPAALAQEILDELEGARRHYVPSPDFELRMARFDPSSLQRALPFPGMRPGR
jgi:predicted DNA-binding transcriptional regulator YafY